MRKTILSFVLILTILFFAACNFQIPQKVEVKAKPEIEATMGGINIDASEYLNLDKLKELLGGSDLPMDIRNYYDSDPLQANNSQYLMKVPLISSNLDIGATLEELDIQGLLNGLFPNVDLTVPEISSGDTPITGEVNFASVNVINVAPVTISLSCPETESSNPIVATLPVTDLRLTGFSSASFHSGNLSLVFSRISDPSPDFVLSLTNIKVLDSTNRTIFDKEVTLDLVEGGTVNLALSEASVNLTNQMKVILTGSTSGGTWGHENSVSINVSITDNPRVKFATGFNPIEPIVTELPEQSIPLAGTGFNSAKVKTGVITIDLTNGTDINPFDGFTGITPIIELTLEQDNDQVVLYKQIDITSGKCDIPLNEMEIQNSNIKINSKLELDIANTIQLPPVDPEKIEFTISYSITEFSWLSANMNETGNPFNINFEEELPDELKEWVNAINFDAEKLGLKLTVNNQLPEGNDIDITLTSAALGMEHGVTNTYIAGENLPKNFVNPEAFSFRPREISSLSGSINIEIAGYDASTNILTLRNLRPGNISLSGEVELIMDWNTISVSPDAETGSISGCFPTEGPGIDMSLLKDFLGDDINFDNIQAYLYLQADFLSNANMSMNLTAKDGEDEIPLITEDDDIRPSGAFDWGDEVNPNPYNNTSKYYSPDLSSPTIDFSLSDVINTKSDDLSFDYSFNVDEITINKEAIGSNTKIDVALVLKIPFALSVDSEGADIDLSSILGTDTSNDLLGRHQGDSFDFGSITESIKACKLNLKYNNTIFNTSNDNAAISFVLYDGDLQLDGNYPFEKRIELRSGEGNESQLEMTVDDLDYIIHKNPFSPKMKIHFDEGTYSLNVTPKFELNLGAIVETEIDQSISLNGGR